MAKGRSGRGRRDAYVIANDPLPSPTVTPPVVKKTPVADRRSHHPEAGQKPALTFAARPAFITVLDKRYAQPKKQVTRSNRNVLKRSGPQRGRAVKIQGRSQTQARLSFALPSTVPICVRRKTRREVLHALKRTRSGKGKSPRRSWVSKIRC